MRTHPATGEKVLYVNRGFTSHVEGMEPDESRRLLVPLSSGELPRVPGALPLAEGLDRVLGQPRDAALRRLGLLPAVRVMERVTVVGDKPD